MALPGDSDEPKLRTIGARALAGARQKRKPDIDLPTVDEGVPIPLVYGKTRIRSPGLVWWGNETLRANTVSSGPNGVTVFDEVHMGMQFGLCHGPVDDLTKIWAGDNVVWSGSAITEGLESDGGYEFDIDLLASNQSVFGGLYKGGHFRGRVRWFPGNTTQTANSYLDSNVGGVNSAYRGVSYAVFRGFNDTHSFQVGRDFRPPPIHFEIEHYPDAVNGGATKSIGSPDGDANPAEVIYDLLTGGYGRLGLAASNIDTTSFTNAAVALHAVGTGDSPADYEGVSFAVTAGTPAIDVINDILRHIDAVLYIDPLTQKLVIKLIRDDYDVGTIPSFTQADMVADGVLDWDQDMGDETISEVKVSFEDRNANYQTHQGTSQNLAQYHGVATKRNRAAALSFPMIRRIDAAIRLATRELQVLSTPRQTARLAFKRKVIELRPGDVFKWTFSDYGVTDKVFRVLGIDWGNKENGRIVLDVAADFFAQDNNIFENPSYSAVASPAPPVEATSQKTIEMPQWFGYKAEIRGLIDTRHQILLFFMADANSVNEDKFRAYTSVDSNPYFTTEIAYRSMGEAAEVQTEYSKLLEPYDTSTGLILKGLSPGFEDLLASASVADIRDGANLVIVGDPGGSHEIIAFESFTDLGFGNFRLNSVWRGMLDTVPQTWAVDTKVWLVGPDDPDVFLNNLGGYNFTEGQDIDVKVGPRNILSGDELEAADVTAVESFGLIQKRYSKPYPPDNVRIVQEPARAGEVGVNTYPGVTVDNETNKQIVEAEIKATWNSRNNLTTSIRRGDDASETIPFATAYRVSVDDGSGYRELGETTSDEDTVPLCPDPDDASFPTGVGSGAGSVKVVCRRTVPAPTETSFQEFEVDCELAAYRQLLPNPSFDDATNGNGWTLVSGDVSYVEDNEAYGFVGKYLEADGSTGGIIERTIHVANLSPSGKRLRLRFNLANKNNAGACVKVTMYTEDAADTVLQEVSSFLIDSVPGGAWGGFELNIGEIDASTTQVRVRVQVDRSDGGPTGAVDHMDLRMFGGAVNDLVNGGFLFDMSSWTVSNMSRTTSGVTEGFGAAIGNSAATCQAYQNVNFPSQFADNDIVHLRAIRRETDANATGQLTLELRQTSDDALLDSISTAAETLNDGDWHIRDLYMKVTTHTGRYMRAVFDGVRLSGTPLNAMFDDVQMNMYTAAANPREITSITTLASGHDSSTSSSDYTTASATPATYQFNLLAVLTASNNGVTTPTGVTGAGLTWESVGTPIVIGSGANAQNLSLWRAFGPSTQNGALGVAYGGASRDAISYIWSQFDGVSWEGTNGSGAVLQQDTDTQTGGGNPSVSLSAFENAANLMIVVAADDQDGLTVDTDFTTLTQVGGTGPTSGLWMTHATGETTNDATAGAGASGLWALELKSEE